MRRIFIRPISGARALILKHRHEQENGRTSAVTVEIMGYKVKGGGLISHEPDHDYA